MISKYEGDLLLTPCPTLLVTSKYDKIENVLTVAWAGIASSKPEYITISINPKRYSYHLIAQSKKFCINIPDRNLLQQVDYCGSHSGRFTDKFSDCGFSKIELADFILIEQCKFYLLCDVENEIDLGSHHLFVARVREKYSNFSEEGQIYRELQPLVYYRPYYFGIKEKVLGEYGFSAHR